MTRKFKEKAKKFFAGLALLSIEMIIVVTLFISALVVFIFVTRRIFVLNSTAFDTMVFRAFESVVSSRNNDIILFFTHLGSHKFLIPANLALIAFFLLVRKYRWYSIKIPAIALTSLGLMTLLKHLFNRTRPDIPLLYEAEGLSFPSGHALMSVTFYGLLVYIVYKMVRPAWARWSLITLLVLLILVIGLTRVYLRVHYASDVIAGYCIGFLWLVFAIWLLNRIEKFSRRNIAPQLNAQATGPQSA